MSQPENYFAVYECLTGLVCDMDHSTHIISKKN